MARMDKESEARAQGMSYAYRYAKEKGLDELELEIKRRGYTNLPFKYSDTQIKNTIREISGNCYTMMLTAFLYVLHEHFGFGLQRLTKAKEEYTKLVDCVFDLDYMGEHYISMGDYADELCEKYGPLVDVMKVKNLQRTFDNKDDDYRVCNVDRLIEMMKLDGQHEAAAYLEKKLAG